MESGNSNSFKAINWPVLLDRVLGTGIVIFLTGLIFHLVIKGVVPDPLGTYWKEILLGILILIWLARSALTHRLELSHPILDLAVIFYIALIVTRFLFDGADLVAWWGLYISILYLPLVFIVRAMLRRYPDQLNKFIGLLVGLGSVVALGGVLEFILNRALWPSAEMVARQGFPDVYIYETHLRRVYFVFDSPATMATTLGMLLPLGFYMFFSQSRRMNRIVAGAATAMIFAGILLTFSRGIWVALVLAAFIVILFKWLVEGNLAFIRTGIKIGAAALAIFVIVLLLRPASASVSNRFTTELSTNQFKLASLQGNPVQLMNVQPYLGDPEFQNWTLYDGIDEWYDTRNVLYMPLTSADPQTVIYRVTVPVSGALRFAIGMNPEVWSPEMGDGTYFKILLKKGDAQDKGEALFERYINPKLNPNDRRWRNYVVDLSSWAGQVVDLYFITSPGPSTDYAYDWAGWANLEVGAISSQFADAKRPASSNPIVTHLTSIVDWQKDETNRDRLLAWSLGVSAWLKSPIWGSGLGTTGVAALRTMPGTAFVTESQFLKVLVELGILGLLAWGFLWFVIIGTAVWLYRSEAEPGKRILILSLACSLLVVLIASVVYQNMEVKQINAIFWSLVGVLSFLVVTKRTNIQVQETEEV
jgi:hypothetical protein